MTFEEMCSQAVDNGKKAANPEAHLDFDDCSKQEQSRRISRMFSNIAVKRSTRETWKNQITPYHPPRAPGLYRG
jgi:hypothetical protein